MAIIKCSECGHDVSDKAAICPHCGYSVSEILKSINQEMESQEPKNECIICGSSFTGDVCPNCGARAVSPGNKSEDQPESTTPGAEKCSRCGKEISDNDEMIAEREIFSKIHSKLAKYGFILRYLDGKDAITGYSYEPWHFRYINDPEVAKEYIEKHMRHFCKE